MSKKIHKPITGLFPLSAVLVTAQSGDIRPNIITIAWTGVMNSIPPVVYVGVNPLRYSNHLIAEAGEYVINIPSADQVPAVDYCGLVSGRDVDKFEATGFTPVPAEHVQAPLIAECPVNIECKVRQVLHLESHDVFIADVLAVHYNEEVLDEKGRPDYQKIKPYGYCLGEYYGISDKLGSQGFSRKLKHRIDE
ncbi:flavin reductase family protein [Desulfitobacterium sp.]|uniref:flavin reductase family protein n=1 Tax=Desulfitobacterium sp. TaxID=49981 RepID=UPI002C496374|nr:flavin reductase family protein [Desulfitobacterium sp.]HVJ47862.1 flavin reductase family protein [Desulfitobacterium sp.]